MGLAANKNAVNYMKLVSGDDSSLDHCNNYGFSYIGNLKCNKQFQDVYYIVAPRKIRKAKSLVKKAAKYIKKFKIPVDSSTTIHFGLSYTESIYIKTGYNEYLIQIDRETKEVKFFDLMDEKLTLIDIC